MAEKGKKSILVVEDEKSIAQILAFNLMQAGYAYDIAFDGEEGLNKALAGDFDLILLDIMLPKMDGFEVCRRVRERLATPIIMVTARQDEIDKIFGLDVGADDYVTKPFNTKELLARIAVALRGTTKQATLLYFDDITLNAASYAVYVGEVEVKLTRTEFAILKYLMQNSAQVVSKSQLLEHISIDTPDCTEGSLKIHVSNLRGKLRDVSGKDYIEAVWGIGFKLK
jgi:DNA-binding response OmpR family regulator